MLGFVTIAVEFISVVFFSRQRMPGTTATLAGIRKRQIIKKTSKRKYYQAIFQVATFASYVQRQQQELQQQQWYHKQMAYYSLLCCSTLFLDFYGALWWALPSLMISNHSATSMESAFQVVAQWGTNGTVQEKLKYQRVKKLYYIEI